MKKSIIALVSLAFLAYPVANAQEISGNYSADVDFNLFGNDFNNFNSNNLDLNFRYFLNEKSAIRLNVGFDIRSENSKVVSDNEDPMIYDNENEYFKTLPKTANIRHTTTETIDKTRTFKIGLGYELHKMVFGIADVYAGALAGYEAKFYSTVINTDDYQETQTKTTGYYTRNETTTKTKQEYFKSNQAGQQNSNSLTARIYGGANVYFFKNVYLGAELGIGYRYSKASGGYDTTTRSIVSKSFANNDNNKRSGAEAMQTIESSIDYSTETGIQTGSRTTTDHQNSSNNKIEPNFYDGYYGPVTNQTDITHAIGLFIQPSFRIGIRF
jgi:hypothetical protein